MKIKRKTLKKIFFWGFLFAAIILFGFLYKLYVEKNWFTIYEYAISGVSEDEKKELLSRFKNISTGSTLFVFPRDKILSYSQPLLIQEITDVVPSRKKVTVYPSGLQKLSIEIEEWQPVMKINDQEGITKEGVVFPTKHDLTNVPLFVGATTTHTIKENDFTFKQLDSFEEEYIYNLTSFLEKVKTVLFPITSITFEDNNDIKLYGQGTSSQIRITKTMDFDKGWSTLVSAIDTSPLKDSLLTEKENLLYIDLRFGNKVFYKFGKHEDRFQNASSTAIISDHVASTTTSH